MFLKFLDDLELQREGEAKLATQKSKPAIESPYRWRDWGAQAAAELDALLPAVLPSSPSFRLHPISAGQEGKL
jgi:type I restriction enzyme M protein